MITETYHINLAQFAARPKTTAIMMHCDCNIFAERKLYVVAISGESDAAGKRSLVLERSNVTNSLKNHTLHRHVTFLQASWQFFTGNIALGLFPSSGTALRQFVYKP